MEEAQFQQHCDIVTQFQIITANDLVAFVEMQAQYTESLSTALGKANSVVRKGLGYPLQLTQQVEKMDCRTVEKDGHQK
jgi:hypothetical protein